MHGVKVRVEITVHRNAHVCAKRRKRLCELCVSAWPMIRFDKATDTLIRRQFVVQFVET